MTAPAPDITSRRRAAGVLLGLALPLLAPSWTWAAEPLAGEPHEEAPLLAHALSLSFPTMPHEEPWRERLGRAEHEIARHAPPGEGCALRLGAARFSALYDELGAARSALGDRRGAVEAYRQALECAPRSHGLHAQLAQELMHLGDSEAARSAALEGLEIAPGDPALASVIARTDFLAGRWAEAIEGFAALAHAEHDPLQAASWRLLLAAARERAGLPAGVPADGWPEAWPQPLLAHFAGELTEGDVLEAILAEEDDLRRREMLAEALFYAGQRRLAAGETELGRRHLAATTLLKVLPVIEHHLAHAELARMRTEPARHASAPDAE
jgi:tetratricopeptide (TPR) repeat protein